MSAFSGAPRTRETPVEEGSPSELSIELVADGRRGRVTGSVEAATQKPPWAVERACVP